MVARERGGARGAAGHEIGHGGMGMGMNQNRAAKAFVAQAQVQVQVRVRQTLERLRVHCREHESEQIPHLSFLD